MVLILERLDRLLLEDRHVLCNRIVRLDVFRQLDDFVSILDAKHLQHLPVQLAHVVQVRGLLRQLKGCLILHHTLRHGGRIRV